MQNNVNKVKEIVFVRINNLREAYRQIFASVGEREATPNLYHIVLDWS